MEALSTLLCRSQSDVISAQFFSATSTLGSSASFFAMAPVEERASASILWLKNLAVVFRSCDQASITPCLALPVAPAKDSRRRSSVLEVGTSRYDGRIGRAWAKAFPVQAEGGSCLSLWRRHQLSGRLTLSARVSSHIKGQCLSHSLAQGWISQRPRKPLEKGEGRR